MGKINEFADVFKCIESGDWQTLITITPKYVAKAVSLERGVLLCNDLIIIHFAQEQELAIESVVLPQKEGSFDEKALFITGDLACRVRSYALCFLLALRGVHREEWNRDCGYDIFLGEICDICGMQEEEFAAYRRVVVRTPDPSAKLLLMYSACYGYPGIPLDRKEAETCLLQAFEKEPVAEVASRLSSFYWGKDEQKRDYWKKKEQELILRGKNSLRIDESLVLDFMKGLDTSKRLVI